MESQVTLVKRQEGLDLFTYMITDNHKRMHTVEVPRSILFVPPRDFERKIDDKEHLDTIACGTVLMSINPETEFHKVDRSMVNRAYRAASGAQIEGRFGA